MSTVLNILAIALALATGYVVASDTYEPVGRWPRSVRLAVFLVVAASAGLLFRTLVSMLSPFIDGFVSFESLLNFVAGLIGIAAVARIYWLFRLDASRLVAGVSSLAGRPRGAPLLHADVVGNSTICGQCQQTMPAGAAYCENCGAARVQQAV
jgi:hypothetical protein